MALFVLSYARKDGEPLVRKFFDRLCLELEIMNPTEKDVGFMDTSGIPTGATWQETLGGRLESTPVLVPIFSPSFFASEECGREVQAFLHRLSIYGRGQPQVAVMPTCIFPVIWIWENLTIHSTLKDFHYDNRNYPQKYRDKRTGLRMLVDLSKNRDQFKTLTNHLAVAINNALAGQQGAKLPATKVNYRTLPSAFATINASASATGPKSVQFTYVAPSRGQLGAVRRDLTTYGLEGRDWRAFDPSCALGIGHLSESVAAHLKLSYDVIPLDHDFRTKLERARQSQSQVVFIVDPWATQMNDYDDWLREIDRLENRQYPVLVPLNEKNEENRLKRSDLLGALARRLPSRASAAGVSFGTGIADEVDFQSQLGRALAAGQSGLIGAAAMPPVETAEPLPSL